MVASMSAGVIAAGIELGFRPSASVNICPSAATADGPNTLAPAGRLSGWPMRPVCINCTKILAPRPCTASVTFFHPATWASEKMPGMRG